LNFAANALGKTTAMQLADYLADPKCTLKELDLSSNNLEKASYRYLQTGLSKNRSLEKFEISKTSLTLSN